MTQPPSNPPARIELRAATLADEPVLANLLQLYAHDFSEFHSIEVDADGRFTYNQLPLYFTEPDRHPFLITVDERPAGFVLVKRGSEFTGNPTVWDMAEFFVMRGHRRRGLGTQVAHEVWARSPGRWEVRVMHSNTAGRDFWANAIAKFVGEPTHPIVFERAAEVWLLFSFESKV